MTFAFFSQRWFFPTGACPGWKPDPWNYSALIVAEIMYLLLPISLYPYFPFSLHLYLPITWKPLIIAVLNIKSTFQVIFRVFWMKSCIFIHTFIVQNRLIYIPEKRIKSCVWNVLVYSDTESFFTLFLTLFVMG